MKHLPARETSKQYIVIGGGLSGLAFHVQFAKPGSSCFGAFDLSSALTITLQ